MTATQTLHEAATVSRQRPPLYLATDHPFVLHVRVVSDSGGGPDKTILRSARYAAAAHLGMAAAYIRPVHAPAFDVLRRRAQELHCDLHEIPERGPLDPRCVVRALRLCRQLGVTIWHAHDYKSNLLGLLLRRRHPMLLVSTAHGWTWDTPRARLYHHVDNWCLKYYDYVMAVSEKIRDHCRNHGVAAERLTHLANGIEPDDYRRTRTHQAARAAMGIGRDRIAIGVVGRLSVEKGVDRAMEALPALLAHHPHVELHLVGDGPERLRLEQMAALLPRGAVRFHGWQADARPYYEFIDALLLPSRTEGLPNVVLEAMAMGVPVAATNVGGVPDLLDQGRCGVILGDDPARWPAEMSMLVSNADLRAAFAQRARRRIETHFSFAQRMDRELAVYEQLLGHPLNPRRAARAAA